MDPEIMRNLISLHNSAMLGNSYNKQSMVMLNGKTEASVMNRLFSLVEKSLIDFIGILHIISNKEISILNSYTEDAWSECLAIAKFQVLFNDNETWYHIRNLIQSGKLSTLFQELRTLSTEIHGELSEISSVFKEATSFCDLAINVQRVGNYWNKIESYTTVLFLVVSYMENSSCKKKPRVKLRVIINNQKPDT